MQVYLAVQNRKCNTIIVKKREFNNWWHLKGDGMGGGDPALVNQAGQWALPGGGVNYNEGLEDAAIREFKEETAVDLSGHQDRAEVLANQNYGLVRIKLDTVSSILAQIQSNVAPNPSNAFAPTNHMVDDWEIQSADLIGIHVLDNYLGVRQAVGVGVQLALPTARPYSQSIDWYAEMAKILQSSL